MAPTVGQATIRPDDMTILQEIRQRGYPLPKTQSHYPEEISARQGNSLAQTLRNGGYRWNAGDGDTPVGEDGISSLSLPQAEFKILGPTRARRDGLKKWWVAEIRRMGVVGPLKDLDDVFEFLCAHENCAPREQLISESDANLEQVCAPDDSVTNGSSISLMVEIEAKRILLLGDSWAEDAVAALSPVGESIFDAVKISHHGSMHNTSPGLLKIVDSPHYFISTNGDGHEHPDFAVLKGIVDRPAKFRRTLHFNYVTPASSKLKNYRSHADFTVEEGQTDWISI